MMQKNAHEAGADQRTPSVPQYFSWISNTNEGATEAHTLINLDFFRYLKDTYGMQIKIYAWDAGNFDGASEGYGDLNSDKFKAQYPEGYRNVVNKAAEDGIRLGLWGSPDGYGDTEEQQRERVEFFVHLCRDYHFALFKLDGVCGTLRPEKAQVFAQMLRECRKYSPDLIVLNHRLDLYEAEPYVTTFLWNGNETYTDVLSCNQNTAMHNRAYMFGRGHVPELSRLAEDHGVCISSSVDYFEDELIYQAFTRSLILAPEIYGNPWLLRDDELPRLARVYNLHRRNAPILVNGMVLPEERYGNCAAVRGSETKRFLSTGNNSWEKRTITVPLTEEIGLKTTGEIYVNLHHPYEQHLGCFQPGDQVEVELPPFRAVLLEVAAVDEAEPMLLGCAYEMVKEDENGVPVEVKLIRTAGGSINLLRGREQVHYMDTRPVDIMEKAPVYLGELDTMSLYPADGEFLYETSVFPITNDSLESRVLRRSGKTGIPEVQAARDAFFGQRTYWLRGCEASAMFDGREDTFFDAQSRCYCDQDLRIDGGCLRVDLGREVEADAVEIVFFAANEPTRELPPQKVTLSGEVSTDLAHWSAVRLGEMDTWQENVRIPVVRFSKHTIYEAEGQLMRIVYPVNGLMRYFRLADPVDRIYHFRVLKDGKPLDIHDAHANNMQAHYRKRPTHTRKSGVVQLPEDCRDAFLAVAMEGEHGDEDVYCCALLDGKYLAPNKRAPDFKANVWEHRVCPASGYTTHYIPLPEDASGKQVELFALFSQWDAGRRVPCKVYLCRNH